MAPHSSTLAWKIPWTEESGRLQSMGSQRVGHDWATSLSLSLSECESWTRGAEELMFLNCGAGGDSWESLGQQRDQTSQSWGKSVLNIHWKDWWWSWSPNTLATWCESWIIRKDPDAGKDWKLEEKGMTEHEMIGWHHWPNGPPSLGDGEGQGSLVCSSSWGRKELDMT